ncbi:MAG: NfeD family protein [Bacteroidales bacterium]|nr:NfeD family protein [Bacteroidales bacterium]
MSIALIIFLILLGIVLFLIEFLLVPGITIAGIGGAILIIGSVIMSYHYYGTAVGNYTLLGTAIFVFFTIYFVLKSRTWKKIMLHTKIEGKVNIVNDEKSESKVNVGDLGETVTRLNPMGKVFVNGEYYEAKSQDKFIDQKTRIEIIKVLKNKLIVKSKN